MNKPASRARRFFLPGIIFLLLWLAFLYRFPAGEVLSGGDLVNHYIPYKMFFKNSVSNGVFPLWNPMTFCGRPFQADIQIGLFYPPNWLCLLMPVPVFFTLAALLHLVFASLGAYLYSGVFFKRRAVRFFFALVFSFSAFFTTRLYSGIVLFIFTASYIPWILLCAEKWRRDRKWTAIIWLGVLLALQLLAGSPQVTFYTLIALFLVFLLHFYLERKSKNEKDIPGAPKVWKGYVIALIVMIGLSAVQFFPTKEMIDNSYDRSGGAQWEYVTDGSLEPRHLMTFVFPKFFGTPDQEQIFWASTVGFWEYNGYIGILPLALFLLFFLMKPLKNAGRETKGYHLLFFIFLILWLFFGFGKNSPLFRIAYSIIPGFNRFRVPARMVIFFILSLAFFSSAALEKLLSISSEENPEHRVIKKRIMIAASVMAVIGVLAGALFFRFDYGFLKAFGIGEFFPPRVFQGESVIGNRILTNAQNSVWVFLVFLLAGCGTIAALASQKKHREKIAWVFPVILGADLFVFGMGYIEAVPLRELKERYFPETTLVKLLKSETEDHSRFTWTDDVFYWNNDQNQMELYPNRAMANGLFDARGYDPVFIRRYGEFFNRISHYEEEKSPGALLKMKQVLNPRLLSILNVSYILSYQQYRVPWWKLARSFPTGLNVYENTRASQTAYLSTANFVPAEKSDVILQVLGNPEFPIEKRSIVSVVNPYADQDYSEQSVGEEVKISEWNPNRRGYEILSRSSDLLVLSESYYPGWKAYLNGEQVPVHPVNHALMGIFVPPGKHKVEFVFRPYTFVSGLFITALTLIGIAVGIVILYRKRKNYE